MANGTIVILDTKSNLFTVRVALEQRYEIAVNLAKDTVGALELVQNSHPDHILVNPTGLETQVTGFLNDLAHMRPDTPVILVGDEETVNQYQAIYSGVVGWVPENYDETDLLPHIEQQRPTPAGKPRNMALAERAALIQANQMLERRVQEVMTLHQIGKAVASLTDLDAILARIVEAAVFLLRSEESSIMLMDRETNELYLRAQKGLGEKQARGFNLKIQDTLIGSVVQTGRPVRMARGASQDSRLKVVTGYLVNALLYVPLTLHGQVIGVLGVANQTAHKAFTEHDQRLMEALADYAALAIEVAREHRTITQMRRDLAVVHTIAASIDEIREHLADAAPNVLSALRRVDSAVHILTRIAETEAPADV